MPTEYTTEQVDDIHAAAAARVPQIASAVRNLLSLLEAQQADMTILATAKRPAAGHALHVSAQLALANFDADLKRQGF